MGWQCYGVCKRFNTGLSRATQYRKKAKIDGLTQSAHNMGWQPMSAYFKAAADPNTPVVFPQTVRPNLYDSNPASTISTSECMRLLDQGHMATVSCNKKFDTGSNYDHLRYLSIRRYYGYIAEGLGKMEASANACLIIDGEVHPFHY